MAVTLTLVEEEEEGEGERIMAVVVTEDLRLPPTCTAVCPPMISTTAASPTTVRPHMYVYALSCLVAMGCC